jgi:proteasome lid subunit RPN8/RPN11
MLIDDHVYVLALYRDDGAPIGRAAVEVDWEPARQWVRLLAMRDGRRLDEDAAAAIRPVWHASGQPIVAAVRVSLAALPGGADVSHDFHVAYFRELARAASALFVESGDLAMGERFRWVTLAVPDESPARPAPGRRFTVRSHSRMPGLTEALLPSLACCAATIGCPDPDDPPAFVSPRVLEEIAAAARRETAVETGGALIGRLYRDPDARQVFACITAQLPARHTGATATRLALSSSTWAGMRVDVERRGMGESLVGWWHTHVGGAMPDEVENAGRPAGAGSASSLNFFSQHDCAVHRAVFPSATSVALVASPADDGDIAFGVFGWCRGVLQSRGLHVLGG